MSQTPPLSLAVIGAGWSGCAAALELCELGHQVTVFEAGRIAGGRARTIFHDESIFDNGQHILLGAYQDTLRLMYKSGVDIKKSFLNLPLQLCYPKSCNFSLETPKLPSPLHITAALIRAKGLSRHDKIGIAKFFATARLMGWTLHHDCTVAELLMRFEQTQHAREYIWHPLCIASLNTAPEHASARVFLKVLHESIGKKRACSDMLIPRTDLSLLFAQPALNKIKKYGAQVHMATRINHIQYQNEQWILHTAQEQSLHFNGVILATSPRHAAQLLAPITEINSFKTMRYEAICTVYLRYPTNLRLPRAVFALKGNPKQGEFGQFIFDRSWLNSQQSGILALVISAASGLPTRKELSYYITKQLMSAFGKAELASPIDVQIITEKHATFSCSPGREIPKIPADLPHLVLAGDYLLSDYPATLESAVKSGIAASQQFKI